MTSQVTRIAVTPASVPTVYSTLPYICDGSLTGPNEEIEIVLHDDESKSEVMRGNAMEIMDSVFPLVRGISTTCSWQHALTRVDLLMVFPFAPSSRHNTRTFTHTHLTTHKISHAPPYMKVVLVGTQNDVKGFLSVNTTFPRENMFFFDISEIPVRPMSLANKLCNDVRPWWSSHTQVTVPLLSAQLLESMEQITFTRDIAMPRSSTMLLQSCSSGNSKGHVRGYKKTCDFPRL